ncbi:KH domain-containing protein [Fusobacterium hominis]|uniref:KH domain-containing protein n=1 Tax=Fusobacterium hominis TaxID=2764326 RepID=A0A7G9GWJ4_9FUSO|nr:KH domain-containing protein [Fusobacterium hominis]QNM15176.1 KH domain-containing protein [Fusobacterium hominis]
MDIRAIEKSKKLGYMFYITYNGTKFNAFDELDGKITVKGTFKDIINKLGFTWAKGIQQAGRTDAKVSANENILYVSSNYFGDLHKLMDEFNKNSDILKITMIKKTFPNLIFPDMIARREYIYKYPQKKIKRKEDEIINLCKELSGKYDVSKFTDKKGQELKNHIREVDIEFINGKLKFNGDSFMPKQVRIMSSYILTDSYEPLEGKYLTLNKIYLKDELKSKIFEEVSNINIDYVEKIEKTLDETLYIFYTSKEKKGEVIGKNGKNIKSLKKQYGNIVVREI